MNNKIREDRDPFAGIQALVSPHQASDRVEEMILRLVSKPDKITAEKIKATAFYTSEYVYYGVLKLFYEGNKRGKDKRFDYTIKTSVYGENMSRLGYAENEIPNVRGKANRDNNRQDGACAWDYKNAFWR